MPIYLVDRDLPGVTLVELAEAQRRLLAAVGRTAQAGQAVRYLHSTFVPGESHLMCLFEASSAAVVMKVNEAARFPLLRVIEALDVTPQGLRSSDLAKAGHVDREPPIREKAKRR